MLFDWQTLVSLSAVAAAAVVVAARLRAMMAEPPGGCGSCANCPGTGPDLVQLGSKPANRAT